MQKHYGVSLTKKERYAEAETQLLAIVELYEAWGKREEAEKYRARLIGA